jgi:nitrite reductase/ring-hydroxylating ferredoxin subunit
MTDMPLRAVELEGEGWTAVARAEDVPRGTGRVVNADGRLIALFNCDGTYYAIDNQCPHRGGPLGKGALDGATVVCPWHGWSFDVTTGVNVDTGRIRVSCFPVSVVDCRIYVRVSSAGD